MSQQPHESAFLTPLALVRVAGLPLSALLELRAERGAALVSELLEGERWRAAQALALSEALFQACKACGDEAPQERRILLAAKRDVFNDRPLAPEALEYARARLAPEAMELLAEWHRRRTRHQELLGSGEAVLEQELVERRRQLQELARHPALLRGLSLASSSLIEKLRKYSQTPVEQQDARLRKVEVGLLSYLSRMAVKTSPFGTFTTVTLGRWSEEESPGRVSLQPPTAEPRGQIQPGHLPLRQLQEAIQRHPVLRAHVPLWPNPHQWVAEGRRNIFQRLESGPPRPRISHTVERLSAVADSPQLATWSALIRPGETGAEAVRRLANPSAPEEKVSQLVERLVETGILLRQFPLPEQRWNLAAALREALERIPVAPAPDLVQRLAALEECYRRFEAAAPEERVQLLRRMEGLLQEAFALVQGTLAPQWAECILYEDATLGGAEARAEARIGSGLWERVREDLLLLRRVLPLLTDRPLRLRGLTAAFVQLYGRGGTCENLLDFYERLRRRLGSSLGGVVKGAGGDSALDMEDSPLLPAEERRHVYALRQEFFQRVREGLSQPEPVWELPREWLLSLVERLPASYSAQWTSTSYLAQLVPGEDPLLVLNAVHQGLGYFFARSAALVGGLEARHNPVCQALLEVQQRLLPPGQALADLPAVFSFNACLHPRLTPYQLLYPGCWPEPGEQGVLQLSEVRLVHQPEEDRLRFLTREGVEIHPVYLGLLTPRLTPPLFQLLLQFGEPSQYPLSLASMVEAGLSPQERASPRHYPRVRLGSLVLGRRRWLLPPEQLPRRISSSAFGAMVEFNRWRERLGLPERVFARVGRSRAAGRARDVDRKPQFIDFHNPFLLRLFERQLEHVEQGLQLEEVLPGVGEQALSLADGAHACELVLEVNEARWRAGGQGHA